MQGTRVGNIVGILAACCLCAWVAGDHARRQTRDAMQREAIQHHAAEWYVDEDGERAFRWLEREPEEAAETPKVR